MLAYAIAAARDSGVIDRIVVSTDDDEIAAIARDHGAEVPFVRPPSLADDITPTVPVVAHALAACSETSDAFDIVCCIYPAVPLLDPRDLVAALRLLQASDADYAFPVAEFPSPIQRALRRLPDGTTTPFAPEHVATRTQDLLPAYYDAGQFYWGRAEAWRAERSIHQHGVSIILPVSRAVDIDTPDDWRRAERLFALRADTVIA